MKIWHFSDSHTFHEMIDVPKDIDIAIFSGDCSNPKDPIANYQEVMNFLYWYSKLDIKYKIFVAGNHDTSIERRLIKEYDFVYNDIIYLEDQEANIEGFKIYGTPWTPTFGLGWSFNRAREKSYKTWENCPEDVDIIVTHGPPKTILDLSYSTDNKLEFCGDLTLKKKCLEIKPKLVCFGHIHNCKDIINSGTKKIPGQNTIFSNGSIVTDGKFGKINSNGNIFEF